jgi:nucleoside-diphosphate-sugar epimerase
MKLLLIGGSGFLGGALSRAALSAGHQVHVVTRGQRTVPAGVTPIKADRHDETAFAGAIAAARTEWDLVVDCIGFAAADVWQDVICFRERAKHLVFISMDFVYDPAGRQFPQTEASDHFVTADDYGGNKRRCELELMRADDGEMTWTILRPCHIYGPGSKLGCLPEHGRDPNLIQLLKDGRPLRLVGGGQFLQQPLYVNDLVTLILSVPNNPHARGEVFCVAGPDIIESRQYYKIVADVLGAALKVDEVPVGAHLAAHPDAAPFLCHRIYDLAKLQRAGLPAPLTGIADGLREHVQSLL